MNTTTHPFAPEEIMALLDGELCEDRTQVVSSHIEQCAECREVKETIRVISQKMAAWKVDASQRLNERAFVSEAERVASEERLRDGHSWVHYILSRRWSRTPALSLVIALLAFVVFIPILFVAYKVAPHRNAVMLERVTPPSTSLYVTESSKAAGSSARGGPVSVDRAAINGRFPNLSEEKGLVSDADRFTRFHSKQLPPAMNGSFGKLQSQVGDQFQSPMIARTVTLSVVVKHFDTSRASLDAILARHNGYAAGLNVATPQGAARTLQASLRIPAPHLAAALNELKALGRIETETQNGEEVTQQHADLVARLKNSRETEQRLQDVLRTRTGKVKEILEVEEEIARVRGEIEQMEAEQKMLEHRVDFATIDLRIAEEYKAQLTSPAPSVGMQLRNAAVNGFRTLSESLLAIAIYFAEFGPTLLLWLAILFFPARVLWRRYQRAHTLGSPLGV